jgi:hypothetical protein
VVVLAIDLDIELPLAVEQRVIRSLEMTLGREAKAIQKFDLFRKKRNVTRCVTRP